MTPNNSKAMAHFESIGWTQSVWMPKSWVVAETWGLPKRWPRAGAGHGDDDELIAARTHKEKEMRENHGDVEHKDDLDELQKECADKAMDFTRGDRCEDGSKNGHDAEAEEAPSGGQTRHGGDAESAEAFRMRCWLKERADPSEQGHSDEAKDCQGRRKDEDHPDAGNAR